MDCDFHTLFDVKHINDWVEVLERLLEKLKLCKFSTYCALFKIDFHATILIFNVWLLRDRSLGLLSIVQSKEKHKWTD